MADRIDTLTEGVQVVEDKVGRLSASMDQRFDAVDAALVGQRQYTEFAYSHLASKMGAGFARVDEHFTQVDARFDRVDERFTQVDARFDRVDERFTQVDARFDRMDERFMQMDRRFDRLEHKLDQVLELHRPRRPRKPRR